MKTPCSAAPLAVVDLNNLIHVDDGPFDRVDIGRFCKRVRAQLGRNVVIKVFANSVSEAHEAIWRRHGAEVLQTNVNADPFIERCLFEAEESGEILIVSGDHAFATPARWHAALRHRVTVWSRKARAAYELIFSADAVHFIDDLIIPTPRTSVDAA